MLGLGAGHAAGGPAHAVARARTTTARPWLSTGDTGRRGERVARTPRVLLTATAAHTLGPDGAWRQGCGARANEGVICATGLYRA